jgi:hypothetical protein
MGFSQTADQLIPELAGRQRTFLLAGAAGLVLSAIGYFVDAPQFFQSYLQAYMFVLGLSLGCLGLTMIHQLSGGAWGVVIRQLLAAGTRVLPIMAILFLPIAFGMHDLYHWTHADVVEHDEILREKAKYLNTSFFLIRAVIYFVIWNGLAFLLNKWSADQARTGDPAIAVRMQRLSAGGLLLFAFSVSFAAFDWLMSIDPHWFSTIYGVLIIGGIGLETLAFILTVMVYLVRRAPSMAGVYSPQIFHDVANLMLAFVVLWAYFSFSQYLLIWSGNLPEEIPWYMTRLQGSWRAIALGLVIFHFFVPFFLLLWRSMKRNPGNIIKVTLAILVIRNVDLFWLVAPAYHEHGVSVSWMDIVLPLALVSLWLSFYFGQLRSRPLVPINDPQFDEVLGPVLSGGELPKAAH